MHSGVCTAALRLKGKVDELGDISFNSCLAQVALSVAEEALRAHLQLVARTVLPF
jgi:hypothetical protein